MPKFLDIIERTKRGKEKANKRPLNIIIMHPPGEKNMAYTGAGPDGIVQPNRPAAFDPNSGTVLHEGEAVKQTSLGKEVHPAGSPMANMLAPQTPQEQQSLALAEQKQDLPGMQEGGVIPDRPDMAPTLAPPTNQIAAYQNLQKQGVQQMRDISQGRDPYLRTATNRMFDLAGAQAAAAQTSMLQTQKSRPGMTEGAKTALATTLGREANIARYGVAGQLAQQAQERQATAAAQTASMAGGQAQWEQQFGLEQQQYGDTQQWKSYEEAVKTGDFETAASTYQDITGKPLDTTQMEAYKNYLLGSWQYSLDDMKVKLGDAQFNSVATRVNQGATIEQINAEFGEGTLNPGQYDSMRASSPNGQWAAQFGWGQEAFGMELDYKYNALKTNEALAMAGIVSGETIAGMRISSNEGIAAMQIESAEKLAENENVLRARGIDLQEAALMGFYDENGEFVNGSAQIAAESFGLESAAVMGYEDPVTGDWIPGSIQATAEKLNIARDQVDQGWTALDLQSIEMYGRDLAGNVVKDADGNPMKGKYGLMSAADQREADELYGYDIGDVHVPGMLELQADSHAIAKQGMELKEAQIKGYVDDNGIYHKGSLTITEEAAGRETDALYGYTMRDGQYVPGAMELAANRFGLDEKTVEDQRIALFGGTNPVTGRRVYGKMDFMSAEDQRAAHKLYGYIDEDDTRHAGTLEIMANEIAIKQQGLNIEEARFKGYTNSEGEHVAGEAEIAQQKFELIKTEAEDQKKAKTGQDMAAHFMLMKPTGGYNWRNDVQAQSLLQAHWDNTGGEGEFPEDWADRQYQAATIGDIDKAIANMASAEWFKDLSPKKKEEMYQIAQVAAMLSITGGATPEYDAQGRVTALKDPVSGDVIWKQEFAPGPTMTIDPATGNIVVSPGEPPTINLGGEGGVDEFKDFSANYGLDTPLTSNLFFAYQKTEGKIPSSDIEYKNWYDSTGKFIDRSETITKLDAGKESQEIAKLAVGGILPNSEKFISNADIDDLKNLAQTKTRMNVAKTSITAEGQKRFNENKGLVYTFPNGRQGILVDTATTPNTASFVYVDINTGERFRWQIQEGASMLESNKALGTLDFKPEPGLKEGEGYKDARGTIVPPTAGPPPSSRHVWDEMRGWHRP